MSEHQRYADRTDGQTNINTEEEPKTTKHAISVGSREAIGRRTIVRDTTTRHVDVAKDTLKEGAAAVDLKAPRSRDGGGDGGVANSRKGELDRQTGRSRIVQEADDVVVGRKRRQAQKSCPTTRAHLVSCTRRRRPQAKE